MVVPADIYRLNNLRTIFSKAHRSRKGLWFVRLYIEKVTMFRFNTTTMVKALPDLLLDMVLSAKETPKEKEDPNWIWDMYVENIHTITRIGLSCRTADPYIYLSDLISAFPDVFHPEAEDHLLNFLGFLLDNGGHSHWLSLVE